MDESLKTAHPDGGSGGAREASELARRTAMLDAISYAAMRIVGSGNWRAGIEELLDRLGHAADVSRVTLFEFHGGPDGAAVESCRYDWAEPGLARLSADPRYTNMPLNEPDGILRDWTQRRQRGEVVQALLRDLTGYTRQVFEEHGSLAFISVPIMLQGGCWGFLGFDDCRNERVWNLREIDVLKAAGVLIASALERAASEERLRLSEERYALAAHGANDGLWDWDLRAGRAYFSPRLGEILGVPLATMGTDPASLFACFDPADAANVRAYLAKRFRLRRRKLRFECRLRDDGIETRWIVARGLVVYDDTRPVRVVGSLRDITEFKSMVEDLRENEMRVRAVLDNAFDAIITIDEAGIVIEFNAAAARIFGFPPEMVIGRPVSETIIPHRRRADHEQSRQRYLETGKRTILGSVAEVEGLRADGTHVPIELSITEVKLPVGRLFTGILRDLSERKRFEQQLAEAEKQRTALTRYFSPNMVDEMMQTGGGRIEGSRPLNATVLFADLIDFTATTADVPGDQVIVFLRKFHAIVEDAIFGCEGTLDKYMGDGLMATFGTPRPGPRDATNAVACARRLVSSFVRWNRRRAAADLPLVQISVGLHFGEVTLGEVGSDRRLEITVVGDTVNVASRIEAMSRALGTSIVASDAVIEAVRREGGEAVLAGFDDLGSHALRGRSGALKLWGLATTTLAEAALGRG